MLTIQTLSKAIPVYFLNKMLSSEILYSLKC